MAGERLIDVMIKRADNTTFTGIHCSNCGSCEAHVYDSRNNKVSNARRRRYQCAKCGHRYTTYEIPAEVYERVKSMRIDAAKFDTVITQLRAIKVQFGDSNGHRNSKT